MYQIRHHLRMQRFFSVPDIMALVSLASEELLSSRAFWAGGRVFLVLLQ